MALSFYCEEDRITFGIQNRLVVHLHYDTNNKLFFSEYLFVPVPFPFYIIIIKIFLDNAYRIIKVFWSYVSRLLLLLYKIY